MLNTALVKGIFPIDVAHGGLCIFPAHMLHQRSQIPRIRGCPTGKAAAQRVGTVQLRRIHASLRAGRDSR